MNILGGATSSRSARRGRVILPPPPTPSSLCGRNVVVSCEVWRDSGPIQCVATPQEPPAASSRWGCWPNTAGKSTNATRLSSGRASEVVDREAICARRCSTRALGSESPHGKRRQVIDNLHSNPRVPLLRRLLSSPIPHKSNGIQPLPTFSGSVFVALIAYPHPEPVSAFNMSRGDTAMALACFKRL
jgi:hypothetical protein